MKRKIILIIVMIMAVMTVTSCGNNDLVDYKKAVDKTDQIEKGQTSGELSLAMEFNTDGMTQENITELNYYKNISGSMKAQFDNSVSQGIYRNYLNLGGLGFDFDIYRNKDEVFIKLPIVGKYMKLDEFVKKLDENQIPDHQSVIISDETKSELSKEWVGILEDENVFKGKDIVLTTPDGEVKTTVYTITLNDAQVKTLVSGVIRILSKDETLKANLMTMMEKNGDKMKEDGYKEFLAKMKEQIEKDKVENFQYTAYVDIDGYIVNEEIEMHIAREAQEQGEPKDILFHLNLKNWDINQDQKFHFPEINDENMIKKEGLDETMPSMLKELFQTK